MNEVRDFYSVSDINLAATLLTLGYDIRGINPVEEKRCVFFFDMEQYPDIEKVANDYWNNNIKVNPKDWINNRRELFGRINEAHRQLTED